MAKQFVCVLVMFNIQVRDNKFVGNSFVHKWLGHNNGCETVGLAFSVLVHLSF